MLLGADRYTGEPLSGPERASQSIETTLSTPYRSQPGKRDYGNDMPDLISEPFGEGAIMDAYAALIDAFGWEPEAKLINFGLTDADENGRVRIKYNWEFLPTGEIFTDVFPKRETEDA